MNPAISEILKIVYICACCLGIWTCIHMWLKSTGNLLANKLFSLFILVLLLPLLNGYASLNTFSLPLIVIKVIQKFSWLYAPCVYCFLQVLLNRFQLSKVQLLHLLPFTLMTFAIVTGIYQESLWIALATLSQVTVYLYLTLKLFCQHTRQIKLLFGEFGNTSLYWFAYLVLAVFVLMLFETYAIYAYLAFGGMSFGAWHTFMSGFALFVLSIACFSIIRPAIFFSQTAIECLIDEQEENRQIPPTTKIQPITKETEKKPNLKELTPSLADNLSQNLQQLMVDSKPYLHNDLTLGKLASLLEVTTHQLSELLNVYLGISFYDFINNARLEAAKLLLEDTGQKLTILDVAYQSGFNNKNSFYRVFKQQTGMTPSAYRDRQLSTTTRSIALKTGT